MNGESDPEATFSVADVEVVLKLKHVIALDLCIDYRVGHLQDMLVKCISSMLSDVEWPENLVNKNKMCSFLRWKTALEEGLLRMKKIRSSLKLKGDVILTRDAGMHSVMSSIFGKGARSDSQK